MLMLTSTHQRTHHLPLVKIKNSDAHTHVHSPVKPCIIMGVTICRCVCVKVSLMPSSMSMLSHSDTPMAYRSLSTFAHAILPCKG